MSNCEELGIEIMRQEVSVPEAVGVGVTEGISDTAKFLTMGIIGLGIYFILPDNWIEAIQTRTRRFL